VINSFKNFLVEEEKTVYFTFGRMNPPTIGHEKLLSVLANKAGKNPYRVFVSQTQDKKKNPLSYKDKVKVIRKMFPKYARNIMMNTKVKTAIDAAVQLYNEGYVNLVMIVGSDRVRDFDILLNRYNGEKARHGFYNFNKITVISAGERDPDAEGVEGMSASKMRSAAASNDFTQFSQGIPRNVSNADTKAIYNMVRTGMGLKEAKETTRHIQLEPVSEIRESYVNGSLFKEGDVVVVKETGELAKVKTLGSNYVIIEGSGNTYRKWLDAVEPMETNQPEYTVANFSVQKESLNENNTYNVANFSMPRQDEPQIGLDDMKKFKDFSEQSIELTKDRITREKEVERRKDAADQKRHDSMMDRARAARTRKINRRTTKV